MATKSTAQASNGKATWEPPYEGFPLSYHRWSGRLYKKIRGTRYYFGKAEEWQEALDKFTAERDDLYAGRTPRTNADGLEVVDLCNRYLTAQLLKVDVGELSPRTFADCRATCELIIQQLGKSRLVSDLAADDFEAMKASMAKRWGMVRLGNTIQRIRGVFKYGYDVGLLDKPIRFGPNFKRPTRRILRRERRKNGKKMFEADQLRTLLEAADVQMKCMVLLGLNGALGNHDIGCLPIDAIDFDGGWLDYARQKTEVDRRIPLWPETLDAIRVVLRERKEPKDPDHLNLLFVTKYRGAWTTETPSSPISHEFRKLVQRVDADAAAEAKKNRRKKPEPIYRRGVGFYSLRHVCQTIGDDARDPVATSAILGHVDSSMAGHYREGVSDDRLKAVVETVRLWLWPNKKAKGSKAGKKKRQSKKG